MTKPETVPNNNRRSQVKQNQLALMSAVADGSMSSIEFAHAQKARLGVRGPALSVMAHLTGLLDVIAIYFSAWAAVEIAYVFSPAEVRDSSAIFTLAPITCVLAVFGFAMAGLYSPAQIVRVARQSARLLSLWILISGLLVVASLPIYGGRYDVLFAWLAFAPACILGSRSLVSLGLRHGLKSRLFGERVVLIGSQGHIEITRQFLALDHLVHTVMTVPVGTADADASDGATAEDLYGPVAEAVRHGIVDTAVLLVPANGFGPLAPLIDRLGTQAIRVSLLPVPVLQVWNGQVDFDLDRAAVSVVERPIRGWGLLMKSAIDVAGALCGLAIFGLPMLAIAAAIKLDTPGPVFFRQRRHGLNGKVFRIWKFRSMTVCEDGNYIKQAEKNDARVTRVGKFIRKTSLDELPQFFNVLMGEMSIIGPRPHALAHDELYTPLIPAYTQRFRVKPGITGWAQVNGLRGETKSLQDMADRIEYDVDYTRRWWIGLDVWILVKTPFVGFLSRRAY